LITVENGVLRWEERAEIELVKGDPVALQKLVDDLNSRVTDRRVRVEFEREKREDDLIDVDLTMRTTRAIADKIRFGELGGFSMGAKIRSREPWPGWPAGESKPREKASKFELPRAAREMSRLWEGEKVEDGPKSAETKFQYEPPRFAYHVLDLPGTVELAEEKLDALGEDGWELVQVYDDRMFLKRPTRPGGGLGVW